MATNATYRHILKLSVCLPRTSEHKWCRLILPFLDRASEPIPYTMHFFQGCNANSPSQTLFILNAQSTGSVLSLQQALPCQLDFAQRLALLVSALACADGNTLAQFGLFLDGWERAGAVVGKVHAGERARAKVFVAGSCAREARKVLALARCMHVKVNNHPRMETHRRRIVAGTSSNRWACSAAADGGDGLRRRTSARRTGTVPMQ